jgi:hypothetical protein
MQAGQASWSMSSLVAKRARAFRGVQSCRAVAAVDHQCLLSVPRSTLTSLAVDVAYLVCGSESYAIATALAPHAASLDMIYPSGPPFSAGCSCKSCITGWGQDVQGSLSRAADWRGAAKVAEGKWKRRYECELGKGETSHLLGEEQTVNR